MKTDEPATLKQQTSFRETHSFLVVLFPRPEDSLTKEQR